jgi:hypothetical protein
LYSVELGFIWKIQVVGKTPIEDFAPLSPILGVMMLCPLRILPHLFYVTYPNLTIKVKKKEKMSELVEKLTSNSSK